MLCAEYLIFFPSLPQKTLFQFLASLEFLTMQYCFLLELHSIPRTKKSPLGKAKTNTEVTS